MRKIFIPSSFLFALAFVLLVQTELFSQVNYIETKAKGMGDTYQVALKDALKQAVSKVNGVNLEAKSVLNTVEKTVTNEKDTKILGSREFKNQISDQTKGAIKTYDIVNEQKDPNSGLYVVEITATIARYELSATAQRRRIAVVPFYLVTNNNSEQALKGASLLNQSITTYLVQTRKFTVLDRNYDSDIQKELSNLSEKSNIEDQAKIGQMLFSDYILVGRVEAFEAKEVEKKYLTSDKVFKSKKGIVNFNFRVIDVPTKQIKYSSNLRKEYNLRSEQQPIAYLADVVAQEVGLEIMYAIYPILVEKIESENVFLGQGGNQIKIGDLYDIYEISDSKIKDSYTGENLGNIQTKIGQVKIVDKNSKFSVAKIVKSNYDLSSKFLPEKYMVKPAKKIEDLDKNKTNKKEMDQKW
ncbi:MAG: hypothetical protein ISQ17_03365 [Pelagibacteraceae bacterium]|nr:hypothetical protein [Pelagibacteraceae bacterium]